MRLVLQRVSEASVSVGGSCVGSIGTGLMVLIGVGQGDNEMIADRMAEKLLQLRVFSDAAGKMNLSVLDVQGGLLLISQFTLYADCRRGRRPAFTDAALPAEANRLYEYFVACCRKSGVPVACGIFAADMKVALVNDGPVTVILDSADFHRAVAAPSSTAPTSIAPS